MNHTQGPFPNFAKRFYIENQQYKEQIIYNPVLVISCFFAEGYLAHLPLSIISYVKMQ